MLEALVRFAEGSIIESEPGVPAWVFGVVAFLALVLALVVLTRFDPDR